MGDPPGGGAGGPGGGAGGGGGGSPPRGSGGEAAPPGAGPGGGPGGPGGAGGGPGALPYAERMQNVLVLGAAAFLQFTAYLTIQNFETSVFGDAGNKILFTCYFVHIFGSFISPFFTQRLGPRWALALSNLTYVAIVAGNLQSRIWLLALAFAAGGVGGGVWWTAHGEFLMGPACTGPGISFDRASGVFFGLYQFSGVAGNLAAAAILDLGLGFHVLVGLMTVLCALGGLMFFLLKEAPGPKAPRAAGGAHNEGLAALHWMRDPRAPWMWAIMFYWGLSQSYFFGQLPKMVPGMALTATVMACWSLANVVGSFFVGRFAGVWGRGPLLLATTALQTAGLLQSVAAARRGGTLELGHGGGEGAGGAGEGEELGAAGAWPFVLAGLLCGFGDAGLTTLLYAITGDVFSDCQPAAYAALSGLRTMGSALGYFLEVRLGGKSIVYMLLLMLANMGVGMGTVWHLLRGGVAGAPPKRRAGGSAPHGSGSGRASRGSNSLEAQGLLDGLPVSNGGVSLTPEAKMSKRKTTADDV